MGEQKTTFLRDAFSKASCVFLFGMRIFDILELVSTKSPRLRDVDILQMYIPIALDFHRGENTKVTPQSKRHAIIAKMGGAQKDEKSLKQATAPPFPFAFEGA
jgi:hypothetical protein